MRRLDASPFAALFLILAAVAAAGSVPPRGFFVHVGMNSAAGQSSSFCENRSVIVRAAADGTLRLNEQPIEGAALEGVLKMLFRTRAPRLIYVKGDRDAAFEQVAALIDKVSKHVDYVILLTPSMDDPFYCPSLPLR
jgi:biopolymer transport protein ExbD